MACPIHGGDNPSALAIVYKLSSNKAGYWYCNTRDCHKNYPGIFGFYARVLNFSYGQVFRFLEDFTQNVEYKHVTQEEEPVFVGTLTREETRSQLNIVSEYFVSRGFKEATLDKFDVGDCLDYTKPMFNRAIIPIYKDGLLIGCTGRAIGNSFPKWRHSKGFNKSRVVYNQSTHNDSVIIVESPGNVMKLDEAGINASCIFGCKMSDYQEKIIKDMNIENIVILLDNDEAGLRGRKDIERRFSGYNVKNLYAIKNDVAEMTTNQIQKEFKCIL